MEELNTIDWPSLIKEATVAAFIGMLVLILISYAAILFFRGIIKYLQTTDEHRRKEDVQRQIMERWGKTQHPVRYHEIKP